MGTLVCDTLQNLAGRDNVRIVFNQCEMRSLVGIMNTHNTIECTQTLFNRTALLTAQVLVNMKGDIDELNIHDIPPVIKRMNSGDMDEKQSPEFSENWFLFTLFKL